MLDPVITKFMQDNSLDKRKTISSQIMTKYDQRVPVIIGRGDLNRTPKINKYKFVAPSDITLGKFITEVRKHILGIESTTALFFLVGNNTLAPISVMMNQLYDQYKDEDGFLYLTYTKEDVFG